MDDGGALSTQETAWAWILLDGVIKPEVASHCHSKRADKEPGRHHDAKQFTDKHHSHGGEKDEKASDDGGKLSQWGAVRHRASTSGAGDVRHWHRGAI